MARFGGKKYGLDQQAKGPFWYGLTEHDLRQAWETFHMGRRAHVVVSSLKRRCRPGCKISLKKLVVEWGAMGLPVWVFGRRGKMLHGTQRLLEKLQERYAMPLTPTIYAALKFAEAQGADLRAIVEEEFGAAPKRPEFWWNREADREYLQNLRELARRARMQEAGSG